MAACVDDGVDISQSEIRPEPQEIITTTVHGKILDKAGNPIEAALVTMKSVVGDLTARTDEFGNFEFMRYPNIGESAFLSVQAPGYFDGFRRLSVLKDNFNYTQVRLLRHEVVGSFAASAGGTASTSEGMRVTLPPNGVMRADGSAYNGEVRVAMAWVDPSHEELPDIIVGDLSARASNGELVTLFTYGMVYVELMDAAGNELQVRDGQMAELDYPVPASRMVSAPSTIPLWSYDEDLGLWIEEGFAVLEGNRYKGNVSHFSAWNVDVLVDPISITGCVILQQGNRQLTTKAQVFVCSDEIGTKGGWLCPDGKFLFYNFPKDEAFTLKVKDECGDLIYEQEYGPYTEDTDLGEISVNITSQDIVTIIGSALNCDGTYAANGFARVQTEDGRVFFADLDQNGEFSIDAVLCELPLQFTATVYDFENLTRSEEVPFEIVDATEVFDLGALVLCDDIEEFLIMEIPDYYSYTWLEPDYTSNSTIYGVTPDSIEYRQFWLSFEENQPDGVGTFNADYAFIAISEVDISFQLQSDINEAYPVEITQYGPDAGDVIRGNGSLTLSQNQGGPDRLVNIQFRIIRD